MTKRQPNQRPFHPRPNRLAQAIRMLLSGGVLLAGASRPALAELPVPCAAGTCGAGGPSVWVSSGAATSSVVAHTLNINQTTNKAIFNWQTFNVSGDSTVNFHQPGSSAIALNRVLGNLGPSKIFGTINANGQVYLINHNGILFGKGAQVNVGALVASTLDIDDRVFKRNSLLQPIQDGKPAFVNTDPVHPMGAVKVEQGASLRVADGGNILIFAPEVTNAGDIETPDGQAILAGSKDEVYLLASTDPKLRGMLVEVKTGGAVTNLGKIAARRGDVTMLGFAVNQDGVVSATTSVRVNGSIRLLARDDARANDTDASGRRVLYAQSTAHGDQGAQVNFGAGSVTEVLPELDDPATAPDSQTQNPSTVEVIARNIHVESGARVLAPSGQVSLTATASPHNPGAATDANDSHVQMDAGSSIDVSGTASTVLPMSRNTVQVELRGYQLRDAPLQRNGSLYGKTVTVDIRKGTPLADWQSSLANVQRTVGERTTAGGDVTVTSEGDVQVAKQAVVDVSGGKVTFQGGYVNTTKLVSDGKLYDISQADPNRQYQIAGQYSYTYKKWGVTSTFHGAAVGEQGDWQPGYVQGADAGTASFKTPRLGLQGTVLAHTVQGPFQRTPEPQLAGTLPAGGGLSIDLGGVTDKWQPQKVVFGDGTSGETGNVPTGGATPPDLIIDGSALGRQGVSRLTVTSAGAIHIAAGADLRLPASGSVNLTGGRLDVDGGIDVPGGAVTLETVSRAGANSPIAFGAASHVNVAGQWVNDSPLLNAQAASGPVVTDGGRIVVQGLGDVSLAAGSVLDASAGAWLKADGSVQGGKAGSISVASAQPNGGSSLRLAGELRGYALSGGGTLSLTANSILIRNPDAPVVPNPVPGQLQLAPDFFRRSGFQAYSLTSNLDGLTIARGVGLEPRVLNRVLDPGAAGNATGSDVARFSHVALLPAQDRTAADLSLTVNRAVRPDASGRGVLDIQAGAAIHTDPGARVVLTSDDSIRVAGTIEAPAGTIALHVTAPDNRDPGFLRDQGIWLGSDARLLSPAYALSLPNDLGLREARLLAGGTITLQADRGYIVTDGGSVMDVSGTSRTLDLPARYGFDGLHYAPVQASADAGAISITGAEGVLLDGDLRGQAAAAPGAAGGSLQIGIDAGTRGGSVDPTNNTVYPIGHRFLFQPGIVQVNAGSAPVVPTDTGAGNGMPVSVPDALNGQALVSADRLRSGAFDSITLTSLSASDGHHYDGEVRFEGNVRLNARRSVLLGTPTVTADGRTTLNASYVGMGSRFAATGPAVGGDGHLTVNADLIDFIGHTRLAGIAQARLNSRGDIRLEGVQRDPNDDVLGGGLTAAGDLVLNSAQVYPTTLSQFTVQAGSAAQPATVTITGGGSDAPVLSAGAHLTVQAAHIVQDGVLKAPAGQIDLQAGQDLTLGAGSLTSTSEQGQLIPFGQTQFGTDWVYTLSPNRTLVFPTPPENRISLGGPQVNVAGAAVVDVSGGGDLLAYEFIPGPGGSTDVLAPVPGSAKYAVLPGYQNRFAPYDPHSWAGAGLQVGDSLYLAASDGLPAGDYTLLPARYALLPGAFLVTPLAGTSDIAPGAPLPRLDGSTVVAGQRTVTGTDIRASRWSAFAVEPGAVARTYSEYRLSEANSFFAQQAASKATAVPLLPNDAGHLIISASSAIDLQGTLRGGPGAGGRGAQVDIAATDLQVVATRDGTVGGVQLLAGDLDNLHAASLLLGGTRSAVTDNTGTPTGATAIDVTADRVGVQDGVDLQGPDLILAATDRVSIGAGARVAGVGSASPGDSTLVVQGDGALLRVSAGRQVNLQRTGSSGASGTLEVGAGAVLQADSSMVMDASHDMVSRGRIDMSKGSLNLGANRISLGAAPSGTAGLVLAGSDLNALTLDELILTSRSGIGLFGAVDLNANRLRIDAAGIGSGQGSTGASASLNADTLELENTTGATFGAAPAGGGSLVLSARNLVLGGGDYALRGFAAVTLAARQQLTGADTGTLSVDAPLTVRAGRVTGASGADTTIDAGDHDVTIAAVPAATLPAVNSLGANLSILGRSVLQQGRIELPSGTLKLTATGSGANDDVTLAAGSVIDVAGRPVQFPGVSADAPGGSVVLSAQAGNVVADGASAGNSAARVDLSGSGDGGSLAASAPLGEVRMSAADLAGRGGAGHLQGSFQLDGATVDDLVGLNVRLNGAGFTAARDLRVRTGDVVLDGIVPRLIQARQVTVTADGGAITVQGAAAAPVIDASGVTGGRVTLSAYGDITLGSNGVVDAHATGAGQRGGRVDLRTTAGGVHMEAGSGVNVAGGAEGTGGVFNLRLPRDALLSLLDAGQTDRLSLAGSVTGAATARIEGYRSYTPSDGSIDAADLTAYRGDAQTFMGNAADLLAALGPKARGFQVVPGVQVESTGDLTLATDWDLQSWRFGPDAVPGMLTVLAGGDLRLDHSISDGFKTQPVLDPTTYSYVESSVLQSGPSWSYRLVAGADLNSADPSALLPAAALGRDAAGNRAGTFTLAAGQLVRTGTGSIDIAAGRDLRLTDTGSVIYTAGVPKGTGSYSPSLLPLVLPGDYPSGGGDLTLTAQHDILGVPTRQLVTDWLRRVGYGDPATNSGLPVTWSVDFNAFMQGVGALGGGDVQVRAGRNIENLSVSVPVTGQQVGDLVDPTNPYNPHVKQNRIKLQGGGDLLVQAGGDIASGVFFGAGGTATVRAGGSLTAAEGNPVEPILALADGSFDVRAGRDISLETVLNPTVVKQSYDGGFSRDAFFTYGPASAVSLTALGGTVRLYNTTFHITSSAYFPGPAYHTSNLTDTSMAQSLAVYPGSVRVRALRGDIELGNSLFMYPSAQGNLDLLAWGSVGALSNTNASINTASLFMSDADPTLMPSAVQPQTVTEYIDTTNLRLFQFSQTQYFHAAQPVHLDDSVPVRIVAANGDIAGADQALTFYLPKQARIMAGRDIVNLVLHGQNVSPDGVTVVQAGRDIRYPLVRQPGTGYLLPNPNSIDVGGGGRLDVLAGRNVDLGVSDGILTTGAQRNPALAGTGADLTVMAGLATQPDYAGFIALYFAKLGEYRDQLTAYMRGLTGDPRLDARAALARFETLSPTLQRPLVLKAFFSELEQSGITASQGSKDYSRGYGAIGTLFPSGPGAYSGNISLIFSRIQTLAGGDIAILAPGGRVDGGLASTASFTKSAAQLGVVAQRTGSIDAFVDGDFLVNQSRVFALDGGDILMWSSHGNIDAGRGAKTAIAVPPPLITVDSKTGQVDVQYPPSVSGSGIRNAVTDPGLEPGSVYLFAPGGAVNAGDAGIGTQGDLFVGAAQVIDNGNFDVGGVAVGVPAADTGSLAAGLTGVSNLSSSVSKTAEQATQSLADQNNAGPGLGGDTLTMIDVQVLGFGE